MKPFFFPSFSFLLLCGFVLMQGVSCQLIESAQGFFCLAAQMFRRLDNEGDVMIAAHLRDFSETERLSLSGAPSCLSLFPGLTV